MNFSPRTRLASISTPNDPFERENHMLSPPHGHLANDIELESIMSSRPSDSSFHIHAQNFAEKARIAASAPWHFQCNELGCLKVQGPPHTHELDTQEEVRERYTRAFDDIESSFDLTNTNDQGKGMGGEMSPLQRANSTRVVVTPRRLDDNSCDVLGCPTPSALHHHHEEETVRDVSARKSRCLDELQVHFEAANEKAEKQGDSAEYAEMKRTLDMLESQSSGSLANDKSLEREKEERETRRARIRDLIKPPSPDRAWHRHDPLSARSQHEEFAEQDVSSMCDSSNNHDTGGLFFGVPIQRGANSSNFSVSKSKESKAAEARINAIPLPKFAVAGPDYKRTKWGGLRRLSAKAQENAERMETAAYNSRILFETTKKMILEKDFDYDSAQYWEYFAIKSDLDHYRIKNDPNAKPLQTYPDQESWANRYIKHMFRPALPIEGPKVQFDMGMRHLIWTPYPEGMYSEEEKEKLAGMSHLERTWRLPQEWDRQKIYKHFCWTFAGTLTFILVCKYYLSVFPFLLLTSCSYDTVPLSRHCKLGRYMHILQVLV